MIGLLLWSAASPDPVSSQFANVGGAVDPSVRSAGMGGASSAIFWGGDPNYWANPALVAYHEGLRYEYGNTQLVPDLADDVYLRSHRVTLGKFGIGVALGGVPLGLLGRKLDYGESQARGPSGEDLGTFNSYEKMESFGIGINVIESMETILGTFGGERRVSRFGDVSAGYKLNQVELNLAPNIPSLPGAGEAEGTSQASGRQSD